VPSDHIVINASPLITLCKSRQTDLLPQMFSEVVIPGAVWGEVLAGDPTDPAAEQLTSASALPWARREDAVAVPRLIQAWDLGAGESEVLSYALTHADHLAVLDDAAARRCARSLGIKFIGTVGLVILAKRRGVIAEVMPGIQALRNAGLWLSEELIAQIRREAGEET
jgi:predicted nucleic acid-binding protein